MPDMPEAGPSRTGAQGGHQNQENLTEAEAEEMPDKMEGKGVKPRENEKKKADEEVKRADEERKESGKSRAAQGAKGRWTRGTRPVPIVLITQKPGWKGKGAATEDEDEDEDDELDEVDDEGDIFMEEVANPRERKTAKAKEQARMERPKGKSSWVPAVSILCNRSKTMTVT